MIRTALIIPNMQSSSYQNNTHRELDPTYNFLPTKTMLPLHQATKTMYANMPEVATPEVIQPPYNKFYRSLQNPVTLQQQWNIDMRFNFYIEQEKMIMYRVMSFLRHRTQSMKISLFYLPFPLLMHVYLPVIAVSAPSESKWPMALNTFQILSSI